jgi:chromosome segregation ATPase
MNQTQQITDLERQLAASERHAQTSAEVREKLARLKAAQQAQAEADQRAREAKSAAHELHEAEDADRAMQVAALDSEIADLDRQRATLSDEAHGYIRQCLDGARPLHGR